jgi:hypothetical protein
MCNTRRKRAVISSVGQFHCERMGEFLRDIDQLLVELEQIRLAEDPIQALCEAELTISSQLCEKIKDSID